MSVPVRERRVAWLLNHTTLRAFEVPLLRSLGYEVYTSKRLPYGNEFLSASVDHGDDAFLTLPADALAVLNRHNFYEQPLTAAVAEAFASHFGTVICACHPTLVATLLEHYRGRIVVRVFGREGDRTYAEYLETGIGPWVRETVEAAGERFRLAPAYESIAPNEPEWLRSRCVTLPLGVPDALLANAGSWTGRDRRVFFVCPRIASHPAYYGRVHADFLRAFGTLPHLVGGHQPVPVRDPNVAGWVDDATWSGWLRELRVMYYHSREPRHLHYHPLEAIAFGMPVVFMRGGLLEELGGGDQPGACATEREAVRKVERVLAGDEALTAAVREAQPRILAALSRERCEREWRERFAGGVLRVEPEPAVEVREARRVAVLLPQAYRGGTLRAAKDLARMVRFGALERGERVDVVFSSPHDERVRAAELTDLAADGIPVRPTIWKGMDTVSLPERVRGAAPSPGPYVYPTDGANDFLDCDFWLVVSDRVTAPMAPLRPYGAVVFDYIQRYVPEVLSDDMWVLQRQGLLPLARQARFVVATNPATVADLVSYAGVPRARVVELPIFFEPLDVAAAGAAPVEGGYLLWVTNTAFHKNHATVLDALERYYEVHGGTLATVMVGPMTHYFSPDVDDPGMDRVTHVVAARSRIRNSAALSENVAVVGELPAAHYTGAVVHARALLHSCLYDNGTFSIVDAACAGVPALSSRYPAMQHLDRILSLGVRFYDPHDSRELAAALAAVEAEPAAPRPAGRERFAAFHWKRSAPALFAAVRREIDFWSGRAYR
jgi:glycosyltransferase involved in cell wall biosynthesis